MSLKAYAFHAASRAKEEREFRLMFLVAFILFLGAGLFMRAITLFGARQEPRKALITEAKTAANTCLAFAFMT